MDMSLDGYVGAVDAEWIMRDFDDETLGSDALLLGRASSAVFADSWPSTKTERGKETAC